MYQSDRRDLTRDSSRSRVWRPTLTEQASGDHPADGTNGASNGSQRRSASDSGGERLLREQTLAASEQRLPDFAEAASDRDLACGDDRRAHAVSPEMREQTADQREQTADQRDQTADERDQSAERRLAAADKRDVTQTPATLRRWRETTPRTPADS